MAVKTFAYFKRLALVGLALPVFIAGTNWVAWAIYPNQDTVIVAQNETQTATGDAKPPSTQNKEPETQTDEKKESTGETKKPLKDFQPSEQIEAEQAVDFPYDI